MSKFMTVARNNLPCLTIVKSQFAIGRVNEYLTMHYIGIPRHTQSMIAYKILTEYIWIFQWKIALWEFLLTRPRIGAVLIQTDVISSYD